MTAGTPADRLRLFADLMRILSVSLFAVLLLSSCAYQRHPDWDWSTELPKGAYTKTPPQNRSAATMDEFFYANSEKKNLPLKDVLQYFGRPDGFSPQYINALTRSSRTYTETGGTLRYLLDEEGGEFHVWVPNFSTTGVAVAFVKLPHSFKAYHTYLLYNSASIPEVEKVYGAAVFFNKKDKAKEPQKYR
jgi:hypothetical protein